jgi:transposase
LDRLSIAFSTFFSYINIGKKEFFNLLRPELNPICYLLALLAHDFLHVSRIRVKSLALRPLMSYIYDISNLRVNIP